MKADLVTLPGDGCGPEVMAEGIKVLEAVAARFGHRFTLEEALIGGGAIEATGDPLPKETLAACKRADAVLLGAVGGPQWDDPTAPVRPEQGLLGLRRELALYANLRPVALYPELFASSPIRPERLTGVDLLVVRELTGGIYFGPRQEATGEDERAYDTMLYTGAEIRRIAHIAFRQAARRRGKVTLVDKANVLASSRLWRQAVYKVATRYPGVRMEVMLVDAAAMNLIRWPAGFDVILTENMFGDILSDEASMLAGSMGMLPSASLGDEHVGLYEPIHGSAPDIAGRGIVNPIAMILSVAMLLRHSLELEKEAETVENAVKAVLTAGYRTQDIHASGTTLVETAAMGDLVAERVSDGE